MKNLRIPAVLAFTALSIFSCSDEPKETPLTIGNLEISETKPSPGDSLKLTYSAIDTITEAFYVYTVKSSAYPVDLDLIKDGERFTGGLKIPDSADGLIFNFKVGEDYDANDEKGYSVNLYDTDGEILPESESSVTYYKATRGTDYGIKYNQEDAAKLLKENWSKHPDNLAILYVINSSDKAFADSIYDAKLASLSAKEQLVEEDYSNLITIYNVKKDKAALDSITPIITAKYPKGNQAQRAFYQKIYEAKNLEDKEAIAAEFEAAGGVPSSYGNYMYSDLAQAELAEGNIEKFKEAAEKISAATNKASLYNNVAWNMAEKGENLELAEELSKTSLDLVDAQKSDKPDYYTQSQFEKNLASTQAMYSDTYGLILFKQGKIKEAIAAQEDAVADRTSPDVYERYVQFLTADEQYDKVFEKASEFVKKGKATTKTKEYLATAYANTDHDGDFDSYLSGLEKIAHDNALAILKKEMLDEEAPTFNLKNLNGEEIALADLKGKTVVLDFWATWCGPCKVSFPGMQKAVSKYADNENVEFLFIDTWESTSGEARQKGVSDFIKQNNYTFNVLMDTPKEEGSREYDVVSAYEVEGIPTKFVVGPDGKIKFKAVGFDGNTDGLVEELDMMIGLASGQ
ncbi:peroxiredoxin [Leeuwenhoekiella aestuarii]|uniref:Peroxiredoxin n=1 Tax=Leeuwenhoekiella aestuarii TaxID=2249426 RepID=A0A4Q0NRS1_9FLAO|nr:TlpA disulfide reductase family protein [Leeuwenhoekiella aestuarii]RXG13330.1 peroxiredoxin [Leeuwenhoekiella aestuarii]RXG14939.1 peroxiredoxin [Leeuwenhoekiella aestuarii]